MPGWHLLTCLSTCLPFSLFLPASSHHFPQNSQTDLLNFQVRLYYVTISFSLPWTKCVPSLHSHQIHMLKPLTPGVMVLGDRAFGKVVRSWGWSPTGGVSVLVRRDAWRWSLSRCQGGPQKEGSSANQEEGPHHEPNWPVPGSWTFQPSELWEIYFCCWSPLVHGNLL